MTKCPNGEEPGFAHLFDAAAAEDIPLVIYCRLCGEVRPVKPEGQSPAPIPLDDLPYSQWGKDIERR